LEESKTNEKVESGVNRYGQLRLVSLRYDRRCAYTLISDLAPRAAETTASFGRSELIIMSGELMNICITFLLCANFAYSAFAQERKDVQALIQQLQDRDKQARVAAIKEVKRLGVEAKAAIPALALLLKEGDDDLRESAAEALGKMGEEAKAVSPALTEALKDRNDRVRSNAAYALGQIGVDARQAAPALGELLKDQSAWARSNAAFALGKVGEAKPYLPSLIEPAPTRERPSRRWLFYCMTTAHRSGDTRLKRSAESALKPNP
jgi:HEAT repeat protein